MCSRVCTQSYAMFWRCLENVGYWFFGGVFVSLLLWCGGVLILLVLFRLVRLHLCCCDVAGFWSYLCYLDWSVCIFVESRCSEETSPPHFGPASDRDRSTFRSLLVTVFFLSQCWNMLMLGFYFIIFIGNTFK